MGSEIEIKMIDIKISTNMDKTTDAISLTSSVLKVDNISTNLLKYPLITSNIKYSFESLARYDYSKVVSFFFDRDMFYEKIMKMIERNKLKNLNKLPELEDQRTENLTANLKMMLALLLPTKYPIMHNILTSFEYIQGNVTYPYSLFGSGNYSYLTLNSQVYTITRVILLDDILNNPFYSNLMRKLYEYVIWAENARSEIESDKNESLTSIQKNIEAYNSSPSLRGDMGVIEGRISTLSTRSIYRSDTESYVTIIDGLNYLSQYKKGTTEIIRRKDVLYVVEIGGKSYVMKYSIDIENGKIKQSFTNKYYYTPETLTVKCLYDSVDWTNIENLKMTFKGGPTSNNKYSSLTNRNIKFFDDLKKIKVTSIENGKVIFTVTDETEPELHTGASGFPYEILKISRNTYTTSVEDFYSRLIMDHTSVIEVKSDIKPDYDLILLKTLINMKSFKYIKEMSVLFQRIMEDIDGIEELMLKMDFLNKFLRDDKNAPCIKMDVNSKKFTKEYFKVFNETIKVLISAMKKERLLLNKQLQYKIDDFGNFKEDLSDFIRSVNKNMANDTTPSISDDYKVTMAKVNFGKTGAPAYECNIQVDVVEGKISGDSKQKCNFLDNLVFKRLTHKRLWKPYPYPYQTFQSTKNPKAQGGRKTRKKNHK